MYVCMGNIDTKSNKLLVCLIKERPTTPTRCVCVCVFAPSAHRQRFSFCIVVGNNFFEKI